MSKVIICIGTEGSGKTYLSKQLVKRVHPSALNVFDVNNEWQKEYPYPFDRSMDNFLAKIDRMKKCVSVFEDATSFFAVNGRDQKIVELLTARRHTGNSFIFLFHSFQDVPKYILRKATDIYVFKTKDLPAYMKKTFKGTVYFDVWKQVYDASQNHKFFSTYPPPKGIAPPSAYLKQ